MDAKQHAQKIFDKQKFTIQYFLKNDISEDELYLLAKQLSLNVIRYATDRIEDKTTSLEIFNINKEIEKL